MIFSPLIIRNIYSIFISLSFAFGASGQVAAPSQNTPAVTPPAEESGPTLGEVIASIAEKEAHGPSDYEQFAQMTLQLGQSAMQQGQGIPDPSIWDGIHAVDAGHSINPLQTDWVMLREELEKLLEKPPEEQQQNQENQDQDQSENSEDQNESGEPNSDSEQSGEDPDSQGQENSDQPGEENQEPQENESSQEQSQTGEEKGQQQQQSESLGDMNESEETPQLDQQPKEEQTQVGGTEQQLPPRSAKQAMTLQQLEQLKQQDKPGALHMMLQNAERDENAPPPQKLKKDW